MEEDKELGDERAVNAAIRMAKKSARPSKIGVPLPAKTSNEKAKRRPLRYGSAFERDLGQKPKHQEGIRAKKGDTVKLGKKGGKHKGRKP
jgi:ATP-dependent RNA helicase DDX27